MVHVQHANEVKEGSCPVLGSGEAATISEWRMLKDKILIFYSKRELNYLLNMACKYPLLSLAAVSSHL